MKKNSISFVVAISENGVIGDGNRLLWHLPNDLKHFKALTLGKPIVMGRKTYESIGKALPGRQNIILTRARNWVAPQCNIVHSLNDAIDAAGDSPEIMVIGGGEIYRLFYPFVTTMHITYVHTTISGDTSFVVFNQDEWQEVSCENFSKDEKHQHDYSFVTLIRRKGVLI